MKCTLPVRQLSVPTRCLCLLCAWHRTRQQGLLEQTFEATRWKAAGLKEARAQDEAPCASSSSSPCQPDGQIPAVYSSWSAIPGSQLSLKPRHLFLHQLVLEYELQSCHLDIVYGL